MTSDGADAASGKTLREYIWLPPDDASPAADNDNEEGAEPPPLPLALVTGVNTTTPKLLMVHADHLGRPVRLTDANRATVWQASYEPFGQPVNVGGTVEQNLRFPGEYFLIESGLSYNWRRFYDSTTGRYTQPDPLRFVDGPSVYGYAGASPMMRVDRSGLSASPTSLSLICNSSPYTRIACWTFCFINPSVCSPQPEESEPPPLTAMPSAPRDAAYCQTRAARRWKMRMYMQGWRCECWENRVCDRRSKRV